jgi:hypothetical protein
MNTRERLLIVATIVAAAIGLFFHSYYDDLVASLGSSEAGSLTAEQSRFRRYSGVVGERPRIEADYRKATLRNISEVRPNERPGNTFMNDLSRLLSDELGQPNPRIEPYQMSMIPEVEDYYFVDVDVTVNGEIGDLIRLLVQMEGTGLLIKEFTMEQRGTARRANGSLRVKVSRLVQHDDVSRRLLQRGRYSR